MSSSKASSLERTNAMPKNQSLDRQISKSQQIQNRINERLQSLNPRMDKLRGLDLFVLDNSIRETTVGQLRGHTLDDKFAIYEEVKKCGFKYCVIEHFHKMERVGDQFIQLLKEKGEDLSHMFAFTDFFEVGADKLPKDDLPIGFIKAEKFGIKNLIIEIDLSYHGINYKVFDNNAMLALLVKRLFWVYQNLGDDAKILINLRDWADTMNFYPCRVFRVIHFLSHTLKEYRPFGIMIEELGKYLPEEVSVWTEELREEMNKEGWEDGLLLVHVHEQWGMADSTQLEMLASGANGVWAGVCAEGAAMGHASSCITAMNLIRLGNKKIRKKYNCTYFREAAVNITKITTGYEPHPKQPVYGARSLDLVFGLDNTQSRWDFCLHTFLGLKPEVRISENASPEMVATKLKEVFGENEQFTEEMGKKMIEKMLEKLNNNDKEEANSKVGLAMLFGQSGGELTEEMAKVIDKDKLSIVHINEKIRKIKDRWDEWDVEDGVKDDQITFDAFYKEFMAPYFGCYRCETTQEGLKKIDMDKDGMVDWKEFALYLKWAGRQFPDCRTEEELLDLAFRKGLIPVMQPDFPQRQENTNEQDSEESDDDGTIGQVASRSTKLNMRRSRSVFENKDLKPDDFFGGNPSDEIDDHEEMIKKVIRQWKLVTGKEGAS